MLEREIIVSTLQERMAAVTGVQSTARNPTNPPNATDLPRINVFEMSDRVESASLRGGTKRPEYKRRMEVILEAFIQADTEEGATQDLGLFVRELKKSLYSDGVKLGLRCVTELGEVETSQILRPPAVERVVGVGITLKIRYVETIDALFV
jgi:hypothetical protein